MGVLYVTEFCDLGGGARFPVQAAQQPPVAEQKFTYGASTQSSAFNANTTFVRIHNDAVGPCSIEFGTNPTATTSTARLAANQTEYYSVPKGSNLKVAAVTNV